MVQVEVKQTGDRLGMSTNGDCYYDARPVLWSSLFEIKLK